jgi:hypothetical protein
MPCACISDFLSLHGDAVLNWSARLGDAYPSLAGKPLEEQLLCIAAKTLENRAQSASCGKYGGVDFFAGEGALTRQQILHGICCVQFDKAIHDSHNCATCVGLRLWCDATMQTQDGCCVWFGTQCSSFISVSKFQHQRTTSNNFMGDASKPFVSDGNVLHDVTACLYFIAWLVLAEPVLEQPMTSCLPMLPGIQSVFDFVGACKTSTWHGSFGGATAKPLQLWHCNEVYSSLKRPKPPRKDTRLVEQFVDSKGRKRFTGKKAEMKESQCYSDEFGIAVAKCTVLSLKATKN